MGINFNKFSTLLKNLGNTRPILYLCGLLKNLPECFVGAWQYIRLRFLDGASNARRALVVEFNSFHGETLPGFVRYLQDLGYDATVITRYCSYADSPFVRMEKKPRHYCLTIWGMRHFLKSARAKEFDFILYNSAHLYLNEYRFFGRLRDFLGGNILGGHKGFALIEHSLKPGTDLEYFLGLPDEALDKKNLYYRSFVLTTQTIAGHAIPMLNPCYFGEINKGHTLNSKRIFLTIGNVLSSGRNFTQLFETIRHLNGDFEVWIIGRVLEESLIKDIPSCVKVLGRMTFAEMYKRLEQADFFLPLLDPKAQSLYLQGCTSGSRQLILGGCIPSVMHETFAKHYGFTFGSCMTYSNDDSFADALRKALVMEREVYLAMRRELEIISMKVYHESLDNLKRILRSDVEGVF